MERTVAYRDAHAPSLGPKLSLLLLTLGGALLATQLTVVAARPPVARQVLLIGCTWLFLVRLIVCLLMFVQRKVSWFEGIGVGVLYGGLLCAFALWGVAHPAPALALDLPGLALYLGGSSINTLADLQRHAWKRRPEHAGRLYTGGLFRHAMHVNFFGDTLMFAGFALVTHEIASALPVLAIVANFVLIQIPRLDRYLESRYGPDFTEYAGRTSKYLPHVY
jgi:protein-S-isoprenylcysteine O-methyltransferase Ste14